MQLIIYVERGNYSCLYLQVMINFMNNKLDMDADLNIVKLFTCSEEISINVHLECSPGYLFTCTQNV